MPTHHHGQARAVTDRQHGVITRRQAHALGFSKKEIHSRLASGAWTRIKPGIYLTSGQLAPTVLLAAATIALPAVASHESAALLHRLPHATWAPATVTIPHRSSNRFPAVTVHESTDLAESHIADVDHIPTTTIARTLFDLAATQHPAMHRRIVEQSIVDQRVTFEELVGITAEVGRRGRPGTARMRELLDIIGTGCGIPESELERQYLHITRGAGLPDPIVQARLPWRTVVDGRVDFLYPWARLICEADGRRWHTLSETFVRDRRRDNLAQLAEYVVLRFTWEDLTKRPDSVIGQVSSILDRAAAA